MGLFGQRKNTKDEPPRVMSERERDERIALVLSKRDMCTRSIDELTEKIKREGGYLPLFRRMFRKK